MQSHFLSKELAEKAEEVEILQAALGFFASQRVADCGMSGAGRCYNNARMESFFATLKKKRLYQTDTSKMKLEDVKTVVYRFICYYNLRRIYTANGGYPPLTYRERYYFIVAA